MREYKIIVLDVDGTFYDLKDVELMNYKIQKKFYCQYFDVSEGEVDVIFKDNSILPHKTIASKSATEFFINNGVDPQEWNNFREDHFDVSYIEKENALNQGTIEQLAKIAPIYILSSNSLNNLKKIFKHLDISVDAFEKIICSDYNCLLGKFEKIKEMRKIKDMNKVLAQEMISIGDRYNTDIQPMLSIGGTGILVESANVMENVIAYLKNGIKSVGIKVYEN